MKEPKSNRYIVADDVASFNEQFQALSDLWNCVKFARFFLEKHSKYLSPGDRVNISKNILDMEQMYWKYFDKQVKKVRGLQ